MSDLGDDGGVSTATLIDMAEKRADRALAVVEDRLPRDRSGHPLPMVSNAMWLMARVPALQGMVGYNEFTDEPLLMRAPPVIEDSEEMPGPFPRPWRDADVIMVQAYFQRRWRARWARDTIQDAMLVQAAQNRFHPIRDYLATLAWDGTARLDSWLNQAFGVEEDEYGYVRAVGAKTLIAAVRRVRQPGCKFDFVLTIEGSQGQGKSTIFRRLFGDDHFSDNLAGNLADRDAALSLLGVWGLEIAEIEQIIRHETGTVKAFMSRQTDRYRPPYGRSYITRPRQGVLIGTTNESDWLRDATGNRRFWPVVATAANVDWVTEHRDQLWAEAAAREAAGEVIWLDDEDVRQVATAAQADRLEEDPWSDLVLEHIDGEPWARITGVLTEKLSVPVAQQDKRAQMRVARIMRSAGWRRQFSRLGGLDSNPRWAWFPPEGAEVRQRAPPDDLLAPIE